MWIHGWYKHLGKYKDRLDLYKIEKTESLKNAQYDKIENVAGSV
jgi:hypothetical protein